MIEQMEFPITFEEFAKEYGFNDHRHIYTNGSDLIPIFRVKQWLEHDNKLRKIETDTAYECGKHANKWISVNEGLPEKAFDCLITVDVYENLDGDTHRAIYPYIVRYDGETWSDTYEDDLVPYDVIAWKPLPEPYKREVIKNINPLLKPFDLEGLKKDMTFEDKAEIVISQLREDRDRLQNIIEQIRAEIMSKDGLEEALEIIDRYTKDGE